MVKYTFQTFHLKIIVLLFFFGRKVLLAKIFDETIQIATFDCATKTAYSTNKGLPSVSFVWKKVANLISTEQKLDLPPPP